MNQEINYTITIEEFVNFLKGRTVMGEVEGFETPDGLGWGVELGTGSKVLFVSKWSADEDELPSIAGNAPQLARKPTIWVYEKPQYEHDCTACKFLGTYHYFDQMICEYKIIDLYMCDQNDAEGLHKNENTCPTFLGRLGQGEGNYYYGHNFNYAERDSVLKEGIARATSNGLFKKEEYPELILPKQAFFTSLTIGAGATAEQVIHGIQGVQGVQEIQVGAYVPPEDAAPEAIYDGLVVDVDNFDEDGNDF